MSVDELASRARISPDRVADLEGGREWVDRRGELAALAGALRLDAVDLTGQPYPPAGEEHVAVRAIAFQLRREIAEPGRTSVIGSVEDLDASTALALAVEEGGNEHALALALPGLIRLGDAIATTAPAAARRQVDELRVRGHATAAGLLRRLGYRDLSWMLLHRARPGGSEPAAVLVEEVRLLIDMGLPEYALARAARARAVSSDPSLLLLEATANAAAGRRKAADRLFQQASERADDAKSRAATMAARVVAAAEARSSGEAVEHARAVELSELNAAARVSTLVTTASAHARLGEATEAAACLQEADALAPLRVRLDPFARELLAVLPARTGDQAVTEAIRAIASRANILVAEPR